MGDYLKDILKVSENYQGKMKKLCSPIVEHLEINYVAYQSIRADGTCTFVANRPDFGEFYLENKVYLCDPFIHHPKFRQSGLILFNENEVSDCEYSQYIRKAETDFQFHVAFAIATRIEDEVNYLCFASSKRYPNHLARYLYQLDLFKKFSHYFRQEGKAIFNAMEDDPNDLLPLLNERFYDPPFDVANLVSSNERQQFLNIIQQNKKQLLTAREKQCLLGLLQGKTAKQIAHDLTLSYRTIEHFIIKLKQKLNCTNKADLFAIGKAWLEQEELF